MNEPMVSTKENKVGAMLCSVCVTTVIRHRRVQGLILANKLAKGSLE